MPRFVLLFGNEIGKLKEWQGEKLAGANDLRELIKAVIREQAKWKYLIVLEFTGGKNSPREVLINLEKARRGL